MFTEPRTISGRGHRRPSHARTPLLAPFPSETFPLATLSLYSVRFAVHCASPSGREHTATVLRSQGRRPPGFGSFASLFQKTASGSQPLPTSDTPQGALLMEGEAAEKRASNLNKVFQMLTHSFFRVTCVCGEQLRSESKTGTCPSCKREFRIEWPAGYGDYEAEHEEPGAIARKTDAA